MIKTEIKLKEPIYYAPSYSGPIKVSIGKINDDIAIVKPYSKKGIDYQAFPVPLEYVCETADEAKRYGKRWEHWKRQNKKKR
ncbi:MAG: hypothetical protein ACI4TK_00735 [Agathobacter sp.]